jgi:hypothetical protein
MSAWYTVLQCRSWYGPLRSARHTYTAQGLLVRWCQDKRYTDSLQFCPEHSIVNDAPCSAAGYRPNVHCTPTTLHLLMAQSIDRRAHTQSIAVPPWAVGTRARHRKTSTAFTASSVVFSSSILGRCKISAHLRFRKGKHSNIDSFFFEINTCICIFEWTNKNA